MGTWFSTTRFISGFGVAFENSKRDVRENTECQCSINEPDQSFKELFSPAVKLQLTYSIYSGISLQYLLTDLCAISFVLVHFDFV